MRILFCFLLLAKGFSAWSQQLYQLAPPVLKYSSNFFTKEVTVSILFNQPGTEIRYTIDGIEPMKTAPLYTGPILLTDDAITVKAKTYGNGFLPSETVSTSFTKRGLPIKKITFTTPDAKYAGNGEKTLHDGMGGDLNPSSKLWLGFNTDTVIIDIELFEKTALKRVAINVLIQQNTWIFLPTEASLYRISENNKAEQFPFVKAVFGAQAHKNGAYYEALVLPAGAEKTLTNKLRLVILPVKNIPDWHDGKGQHGWFFIDEINVY